MNKYESMLLLKNPRLLTDIITHSHSDKYDTKLPSIVNQNLSFPINNDKVGQANYNDVDFIVGKKIKYKNKRKVKNTLRVDKNLVKIEEDIDFNEIDDKKTILSSKNTKSKKNNRSKHFIDDSETINKESEVKDIYLEELQTVNELALKLNVSTADIIKWLFLQGISVTINQLLDISISTLVAEHYSFNVLKQLTLKEGNISKDGSQEYGRLRAPVITLLGHVDHGKTSLLKYIRKDNKLIQEAGNITQSIGSYEVFINAEGEVKKLIFIDTPGHEAFVSMRERGVDLTDLVVLVVAADDGLQPQTIEAIHYIQDRKLPFLVAINKIDKIEANVSKLEEELMQYNIIQKEEDNYSKIIKISSLNGDNIDNLLASIVSMSRIHQWKSEPSHPAKGTIIEAYLNKKKGPIAQLLIKDGTLHVGDTIVAGRFYGKVKAIYNSLSKKVGSIESTSLAETLCFTKVPVVGLSFAVVKNEKEAKIMVNKYKGINSNSITLNNRISLDDLSNKGAKTILKQINLIIKTSTRGVIDAIIHTLSNIKQDKVQLNILIATCGEVSLKDVNLAATSDSIILVFDLHLASSIARYAEKKGVFVKSFNIIYHLIEYIEQTMLNSIDIEYKKEILGYSIVKSLFNINKGVVAGCLVESGKLQKNAYFHIKRLGQEVYMGSIDSLKRVKDDVEEVTQGNECGVLCKDYYLWEIGDYLECYELKALDKTL